MWVPGGGGPIPFPRCVGGEDEIVRLCRKLHGIRILRNWV